MSWVIHIFAPVLIALAVLIAQLSHGASLGFSEATSQFGANYLMFSSPHWVWAAVAGYFAATRRVVLGGFFGAHLLLVAVTTMVFRSSAPEAANGWLLYFIGSPIAVAVGALIGGWFANRASNHAA